MCRPFNKHWVKTTNINNEDNCSNKTQRIYVKKTKTQETAMLMGTKYGSPNSVSKQITKKTRRVINIWRIIFCWWPSANGL